MVRSPWLASPLSTSSSSSCLSPCSSSTSSCSLSSSTRSAWQTTCAAPLQKRVRTPWTLHLHHRLWAQAPCFRRALRLISSLLPHDPVFRPRHGWPDTRRDAHCGTPDVTRNVIEAHSTFSEDTRIEHTHDRSRKPDERNSSNAQIRTLLEEQRQMIIAEYREKVGHHELQAAHAEEEPRLLQGQLWRQKLEFREARQQSLTEMEEIRKFQSSTFDTIARRKLIEDQNTILELSGRVQELRNEVNCMSDIKDFQDAESVRSGNSHVTSRPVSFTPHPIPEGMLRHFFVILEPQRRAAKHLGHTWYIGKRFLQIQMRLHQHLILKNCINGIRSKSRSIHSGEKWKARTKSRSEMPVWTVSQRFSHLQWRRLLKNYGADQQRLQISDLHFDKFPTPATFAWWKIRFKTEVCTCSQFLKEAMQWIKEVEMVGSVDELRSSSSFRSFSMPNFEVLDARIASALNNIIHNSHFKRRISLEEQKAQKQDRFLRGRQIAYLIYEYFLVVGIHDSVENYADLFTISLRNDDIQEFDSKWDGIFIVYDENPTWWSLGRIVQI